MITPSVFRSETLTEEKDGIMKDYRRTVHSLDSEAEELAQRIAVTIMHKLTVILLACVIIASWGKVLLAEWKGDN